MPSYEEAYNTGLIMTTLSAYIIVIQTMMPSIRTKKTFPTCVRSFKGYPLNGDDDTSGLTIRRLRGDKYSQRFRRCSMEYITQNKEKSWCRENDRCLCI